MAADLPVSLPWRRSYIPRPVHDTIRIGYGKEHGMIVEIVDFL